MLNDLISRSALLEILQHAKLPGYFDCAEAVFWMMDKIEKAPSVDAEPVRHGRWDSFGVRTTDHKGRKRIEYFFNACTACNQGAMKRTSFCPNCGAKMNVEVEG